MAKDKNNNSKYTMYIVKENDTLSSIANKYDVTEKSIIKINELEDTNIVVGQQLYIKINRGIIPLWLLIFMLGALIAGTSFITFSITDYIKDQNDGIGGANNVDVGTVLFSFSESENSININNAYSMADEAGKSQLRENEYFDFNVTFNLKKLLKNKNVTYEISLTEAAVNGVKLDSSYVKVYLEENGTSAQGFTGIIPLYSELENSALRQGSKTLYTKTITSTQTNSYRLKIWVAENYPVDMQVRTFKCLVNVDGYVE